MKKNVSRLRPLPNASSAWEDKAIEHELKQCQEARNSLAGSILGIAGAPVVAVFALLAMGAGDITADSPATKLVLFSPILYLFIMYWLIEQSTRLVRINAYMGYLENLLTVRHNAQDILMWHRLLNISSRYSASGSIAQAPFHIAAFVLLCNAAFTAAGALWPMNPILVMFSAVLLVVQLLAIMAVLVVAVEAHWDTMAQVNRQRTSIGLRPVPNAASGLSNLVRFWLLCWNIDRRSEKLSEEAANIITAAVSENSLGFEPAEVGDSTLAMGGDARLYSICSKPEGAAEIQDKIKLQYSKGHQPYFTMTLGGLSWVTIIDVPLMSEGKSTYVAHVSPSLFIPMSTGDLFVVWDSGSLRPFHTPRPLAIGVISKLDALQAHGVI